jgi:hypothetical protein
LSQDNEVTAQLRQQDKHPALLPKDMTKPVEMWVSSGKCWKEGKQIPFDDSLPGSEATVYPANSDEGFFLTGYKSAVAVLRHGLMVNGEWVGEPQMVGVLRIVDVKRLLKLMEERNG